MDLLMAIIENIKEKEVLEKTAVNTEESAIEIDPKNIQSKPVAPEL